MAWEQRSRTVVTAVVAAGLVGGVVGGALMLLLRSSRDGPMSMATVSPLPSPTADNTDQTPADSGNRLADARAVAETTYSAWVADNRSAVAALASPRAVRALFDIEEQYRGGLEIESCLENESLGSNTIQCVFWDEQLQYRWLSMLLRERRGALSVEAVIFHSD